MLAATPAVPVTTSRQLDLGEAVAAALLPTRRRPRGTDALRPALVRLLLRADAG